MSANAGVDPQMLITCKCGNKISIAPPRAIATNCSQCKSILTVTEDGDWFKLEISAPKKEIDTFNKWGVSTLGRDGLSLLVPAATERMTYDEALTLAAWLVAMAGDDEIRFAEILDAVRNT
jgi:hypothetical protein